MVGPVRRAALGAGLILTLAGCSSSGGDGPGSGTTPPSKSTPPSTGQPTAAAAAAKMITKAYQIFFDTNTPIAKSMAVLQHGATFRSTLQKESHSPSAVDTSAKVSKVDMVSSDLAQVTFTLYSGKSTLLPDSAGYAVREGGKWKVAAQTFCGLLTLEGTAPPACKDNSITSLHG